MLKEYHRVWLEAHQERDEEWLAARRLDGFDVHHIDGDKTNNLPENLLLIEHRDHFMLHSGARPRFIGNRGGRPKKIPDEHMREMVFHDSWRPGVALKTLLAELGWTKRDLAQRFGLHRNTISRWKEPPAAVMAYLKLRIGIKRLLDD